MIDKTHPDNWLPDWFWEPVAPEPIKMLRSRAKLSNFGLNHPLCKPFLDMTAVQAHSQAIKDLSSMMQDP